MHCSPSPFGGDECTQANFHIQTAVGRDDTPIPLEMRGSAGNTQLAKPLDIIRILNFKDAGFAHGESS